MNARMIFRLPADNLRFLLDETNVHNMFDEDAKNLAHQVEGISNYCYISYPGFLIKVSYFLVGHFQICCICF